MALIVQTDSRIADASRSWQQNCDVSVTDWVKTNEFIIACFALDNTPHSGTQSSFKMQWRRAGGTWYDVGADTEICYGTGTVLVDGTEPCGSLSGCQTPHISHENEGDNACTPTKVNPGLYLEVQWALGFGSGALDSQEYELRMYDTVDSNTTTASCTITTEAGVSNISGSCSIEFSEVANLKGKGTLHGSCSVTFSEVANLKGNGVLSGSCTVTFSEVANLKGKGVLSGSCTVTFSEVANLKGKGTLHGSSEITFSEVAVIYDANAVPSPISGSCKIGFACDIYCASDGGSSYASYFTSTSREFALSFVPDEDCYLVKFKGKIYKNGSPDFDIEFIVANADANGHPISDIETIATINAGDLGGVATDLTIDSSCTTKLLKGNRYAVYLNYINVVTHDTSNYLSLGYTLISYILTSKIIARNNKGEWYTASNNEIRNGIFGLEFSLPTLTNSAGAISGSCDITFSEVATLKGKGTLHGSCSIEFSESATIHDSAGWNISGSTSVTFGETANLKGRGTLHGSLSVTFGETANLTDAASGTSPITGSTSVTFGETANLKGRGTLHGSLSVTFGEAANLTNANAGQISGSLSITFGEAATIRDANSGKISGSCSIVFSEVANISKKLRISGTAAIVFSEVADVKGIGTLSATIDLAFAAIANIKGTGRLAGTVDIIFATAGLLTYVGFEDITDTLWFNSYITDELDMQSKIKSELGFDTHITDELNFESEI